MKKYQVVYTKCAPDNSERPMRVCERWDFKRESLNNSAWETRFKWLAELIAITQLYKNVEVREVK
jgi:hypothetical protein